MTNAYTRAGVSLALILSTSTTVAMIPQVAEARRAPQWDCVDYVDGDYVAKGYTYVVGRGYCVDVTPPPPPPPPDPCAGVPAPSLSVGPTSLSLYVGETRTVTTSVSNGSVQGAVGSTGKGTVSWSSPTVSYTGTAPGSDSITVTATNACYAAQKSVSVTVLSAAPTAGAVNVPSAAFNADTSIALTLGGPNTVGELVAGPSHGQVTVSGSTATYTPTAGYIGADSFTYLGRNANGASAPATVSINVAAPAPPIAQSYDVSTEYATKLAINVPSTGGPADSIAMVSLPANGSIGVGAGVIWYTPNEGWSGRETFAYKLIGPGGSSTASIAVTTKSATIPIAAGTSASVAYNTATPIALNASGSVTSYAIAGQPTHGSVALNGSTATYTPTAGYYGPDSFTYTATGPGGVSSPATVSVSVVRPAVPVASDTSISASYETAQGVNLSASGLVDSYTIASQPAHGAVALSGQTATYTPAAGYYGADSFTYTATGPGGVSSPATVSVSVVRPAVPVAADASISASYETAKGVNLSASGLVDSYTIASQPAHGAVTLNGQTATYTPTAGYYGADLFTYTATGPGGVSSPATVTVDVVRPAVPVASDAAISAGYETAKAVALSASGLVDSYTIASQPAHGAVTLSGSTATYTPATGYYGADLFTYTATGPGGVSTAATVSVSVARPPAPVVSGTSATTAFGAAKAVHLTASGVFDGFVIEGAPAHGAVTLSGSTATYTPAAGYYGSDAFTYSATGPGGISAPATVALTVDLPPAPVASDEAATTAYLSAKSIVLAPTGVVTKVEVSQPAHGRVDLVGETATYTPDADFWGVDSFSYTATGPGGVSSGTIRVTVDLPPAPVVKSAALSTPYGQAVTGQLRATGVLTDFAIQSTPAHGSVVLNGADVTYTPAATYYGSDSFTVVARGPGGISAEQTVSVEVGLPGAPTAKPATVSVAYDGAATTRLAGEGVFSAIELASQPAHGTATLDGETLTYTPAAGYFGDDVVTFTVTGPGGKSSPAPVTFEVAKPPVPVAGAVDSQTGYDAPATINLAASGVFSAVEVVQAPTHGTVTIAGSVATYTPTAGYYGADAFTYHVKGPGGVSTPAQVRVTVGLPPAPSVAERGIATAFEVAASISLEATGVFSRFVLVKSPQFGGARIEGNVLTYSPNGGFYGADELTYAAEGPGGRSAVKTVAVQVGLPGAPALNGGSLTVEHDASATVTLQALGVADHYNIVTVPLHGTASIAGAVLTYTPEKGYDGGDNVRVQAVGPGGTSDPAQFSITVKAAPVVAPPPPPPSIVIPAPVLDVAPDASGVTQVVPQGEVDDILIIEKPKNGTVAVVRVAAMAGPAMLLLASSPETLAVTYTPNKGFQGRDAFTIAAKGPGGMSDAVQVQVNVGEVKPIVLPEATPDEAQTLVGQAITIDVGANDKDVKSVRVATDPANGTARADGTTVVYTPRPGFNGEDTFSYVAVNDDGVSAPALVKVMVKGALPSVTSHSATIWAGKAVVVDLTEGANGGPFLGADIDSVSASQAGAVAVVAEGDKYLLKFTPATTFSGKLVIRYALKNQYGRSTPGEVTITVKDRPDPSQAGDMPGLVAAASEAAARFAQAQASNIERRMESLHGGAQPRANLGLSLPLENGDRAPGRDPTREAMKAELIAATAPSRASADPMRSEALQAPAFGLWAGGAFDFGHRSASQAASRRKFETSGLTMGFDQRFSADLAAGLALGFGRDRSEIGSAGARLSADQVSGMGYASLQLANRAFVDVLGGYGRLSYRTSRPVAETGQVVVGRQKGNAVFAASSLGWDFERQTIGFSPYGRVQYLRASLGGYAETGDDTFALRVGGRKVEDLSLVAGSRAWVSMPWREGALRPQVRLEYRQSVKGAGSAELQYADWLDGPVYHVRSRALSARSADLGLGLNWRSLEGTAAEVEYQTDLLADGQAGRVSVRVSTTF